VVRSNDFTVGGLVPLHNPKWKLTDLGREVLHIGLHREFWCVGVMPLCPSFEWAVSPARELRLLESVSKAIEHR
jgi:hypothetical protein